MRQVAGRKLWVGHAGDLRDPRAVLTVGIEAVVEEVQTNFAARSLRELGYMNVRKVILAGLGHEPATEYVVKAFMEMHSNAPAIAEEAVP